MSIYIKFTLFAWWTIWIADVLWARGTGIDFLPMSVTTISTYSGMVALTLMFLLGKK